MAKNFLFLMTDEHRYPPVYELNDRILTKWKEQNLSAYNFLRDNGIDFQNHYTESSACTPARANIFTGKKLKNHKLSQTSGFAKPEHDDKLSWLDDKTKTMGHYFRELRYETYYVGKWHLSLENINEDNLITRTGLINNELYEKYRMTNKLDKYGFDGWIGPEPHGAGFFKSGSVVDNFYLSETTDFFEERSKQIGGKPFLLVVSLVNPHDIVLYSKWKLLNKINENIHIENIGFDKCPTEDEEFDHRPDIHKKYKSAYEELMYPKFLHRYLHKNN